MEEPTIETDSPGRLAGFRSVPVLNTEECKDVAARVIRLRDQWRQRNDTGLYFTIGAVAQDDARESVLEYCGAAVSSNATLREHFGDVLERVRVSIQDFKGAPARFHERFGLPGVMIYCSPTRPAIVVGSHPHVDLQHRLLPWGGDFKPTSENLLSFTLALSLPGRGAGLRTWPQFREGSISFVAATYHNASFIAYEVGAMLCHDGLTPHRGVAMRTDGRQQETRITIQGFGVRVRHEWQLYW